MYRAVAEQCTSQYTEQSQNSSRREAWSKQFIGCLRQVCRVPRFGKYQLQEQGLDVAGLSPTNHDTCSHALNTVCFLARRGSCRLPSNLFASAASDFCGLPSIVNCNTCSTSELRDEVGYCRWQCQNRGAGGWSTRAIVPRIGVFKYCGRGMWTTGESRRGCGGGTGALQVMEYKDHCTAD
jgi:hypothetical protein